MKKKYETPTAVILTFRTETIFDGSGDIPLPDMPIKTKKSIPEENTEVI